MRGSRIVFPKTQVFAWKYNFSKRICYFSNIFTTVCSWSLWRAICLEWIIQFQGAPKLQLSVLKAMTSTSKYASVVDPRSVCSSSKKSLYWAKLIKVRPKKSVHIRLLKLFWHSQKRYIWTCNVEWTERSQLCTSYNKNHEQAAFMVPSQKRMKQNKTSINF